MCKPLLTYLNLLLIYLSTLQFRTMSLPTDHQFFYYMYVNSKIFYDFILFNGMRSHNCIYGYALFSFENTSLLLIVIIINYLWPLSGHQMLKS